MKTALRFSRQFWSNVLFGRDAMLDVTDPCPWIACAHLQPVVLFMGVGISGRQWKKYDFCIGKVVCDGGD
jgi:hypothetical protein